MIGDPDDAQPVWDILRTVPDPEIPVVSVVDLGIVRYVRMPGPEIGITPTFSGCPATEVIRAAVVAALRERGYAGTVVRQVLAPPWSSRWLTADGREKLAAYGIAPPNPRDPEQPAACPQCGSQTTELLSEFGSTPCKSLFRCLACREPFDYFKCH